jgi:hypothetical protein
MLAIFFRDGLLGPGQAVFGKQYCSEDMWPPYNKAVLTGGGLKRNIPFFCFASSPIIFLS